MLAARLLDHGLVLLVLLGAALFLLQRELLIPSRRARWALRLAFTCWALLWLSATPAVSAAMLRALQPAVPAAATVVPASARGQTALVVLGSNVAPRLADLPPRERLDAAGRARTQGAVRWYELTHPAAVIVSGAGPAGDPDGSAEAMADALVHAGVPRERVWLEPRATNTRENARYSVELGRARGVTRFVVVTSALHMPRSLREFRRAGVEPVAAPVDYLAASWGGPFALLPTATALGRTQQCLHEFMGMFKP
ncbi:MAG: hypothetical protein JWM10_1609 [Myxococcaceae bacterium]|nr:hypothetical protein [Myxococcaceae bacterium]